VTASRSRFRKRSTPWNWAWLLHQIEQRYGVLDVDDDMIARMSTVTGAVDVLKDLRVGSSHD